jgi:hypothetical protein
MFNMRRIFVAQPGFSILKLPLFGICSIFSTVYMIKDRLCGLVVRVLGYISGGPGSIPGTTKKNCGSGTGSTQPREYK